MTHNNQLGKLGEDLACQFLIRHGYKILERNHRQTFGEIDIVCRETSGELVLIEVKTVAGDNPWIRAEDQMTKSKIQKFKKIAGAYANRALMAEEKTGFRLDVLAVDINGNRCRIRHYKNIA